MKQNTWSKKHAREVLEKQKEGTPFFNSRSLLVILGILALWDISNPVTIFCKYGLPLPLAPYFLVYGMLGGAIFFGYALLTRRLFGAAPGLSVNLIKGIALAALYYILEEFLPIPVTSALSLTIVFLSFIPLKNMKHLLAVAGCFTVIYTFTLAAEIAASPRTAVMWLSRRLETSGSDLTELPPISSPFTDPEMDFEVKEIRLNNICLKIPIPKDSKVNLQYQQPRNVHEDGYYTISFLFTHMEAFYFMFLHEANIGARNARQKQDALASMVQNEFHDSKTMRNAINNLLDAMNITHGDNLSTALEQQDRSFVLYRTIVNNCKHNNDSVGVLVYHGVAITDQAFIGIKSASVCIQSVDTPSNNRVDDFMRKIVNSWFRHFVKLNTN